MRMMVMRGVSRLVTVLSVVYVIHGFLDGVSASLDSDSDSASRAAAVAAAAAAGGYKGRLTGRCERITIPLCLDMKYNMTRMPNLVGHSTQAEAAMQVHEFVPLVQFGCSPLLKFFLCSLYAPMCTVQVDEAMVIPACRSMCLEVRRRCEPVLRRFNFRWPAVLDCAQLPERSDRSNLCIDPPPQGDGGSVEMEHTGISGTQLPHNPGWAKLLDAFRGGAGQRATRPPPRYSSPADVRTGPGRPCPYDRFVATASRNDSAVVCAVRCGIDVLFRQSDKDFMATWMTVWASLCLVSSLFAVVTFAINTSRFDYPQRPVVFLSVCCACQSVAYLLRAVVGPETVSCDQSSDVGHPLFIIREGLESIWCMTISLILYFFGMASATWWVGLAVAWYLASARRWGREAIQACAGYFHLVAWTLPAVQTIIALALRRVDGDELSGLCYIGNQDSTALAAFVVAPTALYLLVGAAFIIVGFLSLRSVRRDLKHHQQQHQQSASLMTGGGSSSSDVHKLEKLMAKIGLFSVVYVLSTSALLASLFYQLLHVDMWLRVARDPCPLLSSYQFDYQKACRRDSSVASVEMYALKVAASLTVGVAGGLWMFSPKTCLSWSGCVSRLCRQPSRNKRGRPASLARPVPVVPKTRHDSRPEISSLSPAAAAGVGSGMSSALDVQQGYNTVGRRTATLSPTTIL